MSLLGKFRFKQKKDPFDFSIFGTDVHSHLIPGIDDGSQSMEETIGLLQKFVELGYKKVITTPHIMADYYKNDSTTILSGLKKVREEIKNIGLPIEIDAAAEYYYDEFLISKIKNKEILTFGNNHVLFEFSFNSPPNNIEDLIFTLKTNDYIPVLAHFERYGYFLNEGVEKAKEFREKGVLIQLNLTSLTGHYGKKIMQQAEALVNENLVDLVGSDCHRMDHLAIMESNKTNQFYHKLGKQDLLNKRL